MSIAELNNLTHRLYEKGDAGVPQAIKDRNGEIALRLCKDCGAGEAQLDDAPCSAPRSRPRPVTAAEVALSRRDDESLMETKLRLQKEHVQEFFRQPHMPDFEAVRNKRMSELTPEQQRDAHELWLREQMDHMAPYYQEHLLFLLGRLDEARARGHALHRRGTTWAGWQMWRDESPDKVAMMVAELNNHKKKMNDDINPIEILDAEFKAVKASDDPRAVDVLVEALRETLMEHGFDIVSLDDQPVGYINEMDEPVLQEMDAHMRDVCHLGGLQLLYARDA